MPAVASMPLFLSKPTTASLSMMLLFLSAVYMVITLHIANTLPVPHLCNIYLNSLQSSADSHARPRSQLWGAHSHDTGAFANCSIADAVVAPPSAGDDADQRTVTVSCRTFAYRMAPITSAATPIEPIVIGVLSSASGEGPSRREAIRSTWGSRHTVFFIVAGPWDDVKQEYFQHRDLIWLDREEHYYEGLTLKTMAFIQVIHELTEFKNINVSYVFKTDDDSFVNTHKLYHELGVGYDNAQPKSSGNSTQSKHYWGKCGLVKHEPRREADYKWGISEQLYPEQYYPPYCQGAGFAMSRRFFSCAAANSIHSNIAHMRFMPFEDAAVGLLAERCGFHPTDAGPLISHTRTLLKLEHESVKRGLKIDKKYLTFPTPKEKVVQHRIYDEWDMKQHWRALKEPTKFKRETNFTWYKPKPHEIYRWAEDSENNPEARKKFGKKNAVVSKQ